MECSPSDWLQSPMALCFTGHIHSKWLSICRRKWIGFHCKNNVVSWKLHRCVRHIYPYLRGVLSSCKLVTTPDYTMSIHFNTNFNTSTLDVPFFCFAPVTPKESLQEIRIHWHRGKQNRVDFFIDIRHTNEWLYRNVPQ